MADTRGIGDAARARRGIIRAFDPECRVVSKQGDRAPFEHHEWLVTNGLGGYSSSTVMGGLSRRYHGVLVAALPNPLGRVVMLNTLRDGLDVRCLREFALRAGVPTWRYEVPGGILEKRVTMIHRQNTTYVQYRLHSEQPYALSLAPGIHFRNYEAPVAQPLQNDYALHADGELYRVTSGALPALLLRVEGGLTLTPRSEQLDQIAFPVEEARGFPERGALWIPGTFVVELHPGESATLIASTETPEIVTAMTADEAFEATVDRRRRLIVTAPPTTHDDVGAQLVVAADQFIIKPVGRLRDTVQTTARGEGIRTVIAGYHWFTDWGRDTMISLEGLTLITGRHREARFILRTFARYVRDGLIPNFFPDGSNQGLYHTADATLWFFQALHRYGEVTDNWSLVQDVLPTMRAIVDAHLQGTRFGIGVDPSDGLLRQGEEGYQLTWMDAKVDGWVVTPRRGKAVEINALWHNALCLLSEWERDFGDAMHAPRYSEEAARVRASFNKRFWNQQLGHLYDVVDGPDGDDPACRPNQVLAISLVNPVLDEAHWHAVLGVVREKLLTPVGLRSLSPDHPDYKARYFGDLRSRDAAYHQGTVWAWLIGPWVDAWLRVHPEDKAGARRFLDGFIAHLPEFGVGSIAEIFDAEPPYTPRGCIAQAWSVAEVLRCWVKTSLTV